MNCNNCVVATKDEFSGNEFPGYAKPYASGTGDLIKINRHDRGSGSDIDVNYIPVMCNHCDEAPCIKGTDDGSIYKRKDGVTMIDPVKSLGRKEIIDLCPYGAIRWNEEHKVPQIWYFDTHLLDQGHKTPRCVDACPTGAMLFHKCSDAEMNVIVKENDLKVLGVHMGTKPRVYYRNLHLYSSHFIGGTVLSSSNGQSKNITGAKVLLYKGEKIKNETLTDDFGIFRFDKIPDGETGYTVKVESLGCGSKSTAIGGAITDSLNLVINLNS